MIGEVKRRHLDFVAEARSPTGEHFWFILAPMSAEWISYRQLVQLIIDGGNAFCTVGSLLDTEENPAFWTEGKPTITDKHAKALADTPDAANGMSLRKQQYVAFASKTADFVPRQPAVLNFPAFSAAYLPLIMSVGVSLSGGVVEDRGIFRNPLSVLKGDFPGISTMLHSFVCRVAQRHWPEIETFRVRPLLHMGRLLLNALGDPEADRFRENLRIERTVGVIARLAEDERLKLTRRVTDVTK